MFSYQHACDESLKSEIQKGVDKIGKAIGDTLGPQGRTVLFKSNAFINPIVTKDGVTIARFFKLDESVQDVAASIVRQASEQTNTEAGDGTTTTVILTQSLYNIAQKYSIAGYNILDIKRGLNKLVEVVLEKIKEYVMPIESIDEIKSIATISANNDATIGTLIAEAIDKVGKDGSIKIKEAKGLKSSLDIVEGFRFSSGYGAAVSFITDEKERIAEYINPMFLITDHDVADPNDIMPSLEIAARANKPLIVVAEKIHKEALGLMITNYVRSTVKVCAVVAPLYGQERRELLQDLAVSLGATFFSQESGRHISKVTLEDFGNAEEVQIKRNETVILGTQGNPEEIDSEIKKLKKDIQQEQDLDACKKIQERIGRLVSGVAVIAVGGRTEAEVTEKKYRVDDALSAAQAALKDGIVPGGGTVFRNIALDIVNNRNDWNKFLTEEEFCSLDVLKEALLSPIKRLCTNSNVTYAVISKELDNTPEMGYDFKKLKIANLTEKGIVDPAKVLMSAISNSVSAASVLLETNYCVVEKKVD